MNLPSFLLFHKIRRGDALCSLSRLSPRLSRDCPYEMTTPSRLKRDTPPFFCFTKAGGEMSLCRLVPRMRSILLSLLSPRLSRDELVPLFQECEAFCCPFIMTTPSRLKRDTPPFLRFAQVAGEMSPHLFFTHTSTPQSDRAWRLGLRDTNR